MVGDNVTQENPHCLVFSKSIYDIKIRFHNSFSQRESLCFSSTHMASPYVTCRLDDTSRVQSLERRVLIVPMPNNNCGSYQDGKRLWLHLVHM